MPEIRYFRVTETREVKVAANAPEDAIRIAAAAFKNGQNQTAGVIDGPTGVYGNTTTEVRTTDMTSYEER